MLRITCISGQHTVTLKLEGKLAGAWVDEVEKAWCSMEQPPGEQTLIVDLNDVTSVDLCGRQLLKRMHAAGAAFLAEGLHIRHMLRHITGDES